MAVVWQLLETVLGSHPQTREALWKARFPVQKFQQLLLEQKLPVWIPWRGLFLFSCQVVSNSFVISWTVAHQAPLSVEFPRQEYWSVLLFTSPRDLPDPGIEHVSLMSPALAGGFFTTRATGKLEL